VKTWGKQQVYKLMDMLLAVPWYSNLLDDQDHEDETKQGWLLVLSKQGWHVEMAKWIAKAWAAKLDEELDDDNIITCGSTHPTKWKPVTLTNLFGGQEPLLSWPIHTEIDMEAALMEALADADEDEQLDDGAVEIGSEEYHGWCTYIQYNLKNMKNQKSKIN
jgi:hypothetical protein